MEQVISSLAGIDAPNLQHGSDKNKLIELAKWLSDWHLVAFMETTQLLSSVSGANAGTPRFH